MGSQAGRHNTELRQRTRSVGDNAQMAELLVVVEPVARLDLDRSNALCSEPLEAGDETGQQRLVRRLAGLSYGAGDAAAGLQNLRISKPRVASRKIRGTAACKDGMRMALHPGRHQHIKEFRLPEPVGAGHGRPNPDHAPRLYADGPVMEQPDQRLLATDIADAALELRSRRPDHGEQVARNQAAANAHDCGLTCRCGTFTPCASAKALASSYPASA